MTLSPAAPPAPPAPHPSPHAAWAIMAAYALLAGATATLSHGFFEADAYTHLLYSQWAWDIPRLWVDVWGRPACTALYAWISPWVDDPRAGMLVARLWSVSLCLMLFGLTSRAARGMKLSRTAVLAALAGQPLLFLFSQSVMTELVFALLLAGGWVCWVEQKWLGFAILAGLLPAARPEGLILLPMVLALLIRHGRGWACGLALLPLGAWSLAGAVITGESSVLTWLVSQWPYSSTSAYGRGWPGQFVGQWPVVVGLGLPWLLLGLREAWRQKGDLGLSAAVLVGATLLHTALWMGGWMGSYGEIRYLGAFAPFWALVTAAGVKAERGWSGRRLLVGVSLLTLLLMSIWKCTLGRLAPDQAHADEALAWVEAHRPASAVLASHPAVWMARRTTLADAQWTPDRLHKSAPGTGVLWEPRCGPMNADMGRGVTLDRLASTGWQVVKRFPSGWVWLERITSDSTNQK